ncbi:MAG: UDP-2,4-diacetamido-2,4,6-trideoxy-beta-L-altropyranose hydrolase [Nitrospirae bacterium]|nr:UDP-2,4-diacetamido-2,4,6-trideoxy-beta-L-altropyranose hydrolase [Nitrospirota bacterium]
MSNRIPRVIILTEGGNNIGFGHITRCDSLYQAFLEEGLSADVIVNGDTAVEDFLSDKRFRLFDWLKEDEALDRTLEDADIVIIDSYMATYGIYERLSMLVKVPVYMDDYKRLDYPKGIVLNGGINAEELNYPERTDITYLLGSRYIPLRKAFWDFSEKVINENIDSLMITFGGDDDRNITPRVLSAIVERYPGVLKAVAIGKGFNNVQEIEKSADNKTNIIYYPDAAGMKDIMIGSDVAISAAGQTLYELARFGVPTIAVAVADNQMNNIKGWQESGFIEYAGWWADGNLMDNVLKALARLEDRDRRIKMAQTGRAMVDGKGAGRVVDFILKMFQN